MLTKAGGEWVRVGDARREWLLIEHESGRLEDVGYVDFHRLMPCYSPGSIILDGESRPRSRVEWRDADRGIGGAVILLKDDYGDDDLPKEPYTVDMPDGTRQLWHFGEHAYQAAKRGGILFSDAPEHMVELPVLEGLFCE